MEWSEKCVHKPKPLKLLKVSEGKVASDSRHISRYPTFEKVATISVYGNYQDLFPGYGGANALHNRFTTEKNAEQNLRRESHYHFQSQIVRNHAGLSKTGQFI